MTLRLIQLTKDHREQLGEMLEEWKKDQEENHTNHSPWAIFKNDWYDFDYYLEHLAVKEPMNGLVPESVFFLLDDERDRLLGAVAIRHYLNEYLLKEGGHIGDGIRPSERGKGYATEMIRLALDECRKLGIDTGDFIALEPRFMMSNGYLKSRFIDDKACAAVLLSAMKELREQGLELGRKVYAYFSMYEEIGHGTTWLPRDVRDMLAIDIAPTGPEQNSDERRVSIFAKDSRYPYHWGMTNELRETARDAGVDYVMDVFTPHYGTDCDPSLTAGYDIRHAAIGPGTANSHGYERTHIKGLENTYLLLMAYLLK